VRQIFPPAAAAPDIGPVADDREAVQPAVAALAELYAYPDRPEHGVPWVRANMIASADGAATINGRSGQLSGPADRLVFAVLRSLADVILVGAGTARAEKYRPVQEHEVWKGLREGRALTPPIAVVTRELDLDLEGPLVTGVAGGARTIVLTTEAARAGRRAAAAAHADVIVAGKDSVEPAAAVGALAARGHWSILVEGGPALLRQITEAGLLDELCLTFSPVLEGGRAGRIVAAPGAAGPGRGRRAGAAAWHGTAIGLTLAHVLEDRGSLLCRYLRAAG
jgi:riboflavin biosynthesis pyrimidine reductase